jgi:glycosyltransferase involved in cell wall biosynthesis
MQWESLDNLRRLGAVEPIGMRILYSHRIQSRDGQSVHVDELVAALRQAGHEVLVVGPSFYQESGFGGESRVVAVLRRLLPGCLGEIAELGYNIPAYMKLRRAWRYFRPDLIYERYNLYYLAGALLARRHRVLFYLEVNSPLADERSHFSGLRLRRLAHALERRIWRSADRVLAVTSVLKEMIVAKGTPAERVRVVPNGVVLDRYPLTSRTAAPPLVLGFVGFVRAWHGLDEIVRAIAEFGGRYSITLTVVGDGPARSELQQLAADLGIAGRIQFTGLVEHEVVPSLVSGFDVALQPKAVAYASPLKIFDYMAAGCAIVAPNQPNIREILVHERTALLFNPATPGALWQAISRLIEDRELRLRLGAKARAELNCQNWTWQGNAHRIGQWAEADRQVIIRSHNST